MNILLANSCYREPEIRTVVEYRLIQPPESLLVPCPEVPLDMKTNGDMVMTIIELSTQYYLCSMKIQSLSLFYQDNKDILE